MTQTQKDFIMHLAIVVISSVLYFLLTYIQEFKTPLEAATFGGAFATLGVGIKMITRTLC